ncbi:MAG: hypothetical protein DDT22_00334 [candidate division WS2 bacterium]|nr:hypothetical protein [Bacillota bacterium]MBT9174673.1 hypothetical protein [Candidatus Lithacetigena glycinireducens]
MKDKLGYEWWEEILKAQRVISGKFPESVVAGIIKKS